MFQKIRHQLLLSYLAVLIVILGVFTIAVRIAFARSLDQQLTNQLQTLARGAALNLGITDEDREVETEDPELEVDVEEILISSNQAIQWFDTEGNLLEEQGDYILKLPLNPNQPSQMQITPYPASRADLLMEEK